MTHIAIEVFQSKKTGINSPESYVVTRNKVSFLRILGAEPQWEIMTATANEDHGRIKVCSNQARLIESALQLGAEIETHPSVEKDFLGRQYVKICVITQPKDHDDEKFNSELSILWKRFFEIYDSHADVMSKSENEMLNLYHDLSNDDQGGDVYLSDGVWFGSDGSLHDRGR